MEARSRCGLGEMPDPELREDDVLVQVHAAGVNLLDSKIRNGEFKLILPYRLPLILGHDVAGVVVRVGSQRAAIQARRRGLCAAGRRSHRHVRGVHRHQEKLTWRSSRRTSRWKKRPPSLWWA